MRQVLPFRRGSKETATRVKLLEVITSNPGITKTELCRQTGLSWGTIYHHVRVMMRNGSVRQHPSTRRVFLYSSSHDGGHLPHLRLLRDELPTRILTHVHAKPRSGIQDISRALHMSRKVVRRHLADLVQSGLLSKSDHYRPKFEIAMPWLSLGLMTGTPGVGLWLLRSATGGKQETPVVPPAPRN